MTGPSGKNDDRNKETRQDRLKLALRENLKRRKAQERGRTKLADASPSGHEAPPHEAPPLGQVGKDGEE
jgi:hypothetical protein